MAITTLLIGKTDYTYGAGNIVNRRIKFERDAGRPDTIKARIITLPGNDPVTTVNDIIVRFRGAWENKYPKLSDLSMVQQDRVIRELSHGRREITRKVIGGLIISLPLWK